MFSFLGDDVSLWVVLVMFGMLGFMALVLEARLARRVEMLELEVDNLKEALAYQLEKLDEKAEALY